MTKLFSSLEAGRWSQGHGAQHTAAMPATQTFNTHFVNKIRYNQTLAPQFVQAPIQQTYYMAGSIFIICSSIWI